MGLTWWVYGTIGMLGEAPKWEVKEVVYASGTTDDSGLSDAALEEARTLDTSALPPPEELNELDEAEPSTSVRDEVEPTLGGWMLLPESNPSFGEAKATVDEHFVAHPGRGARARRARRTTSPSTPSSGAARRACPRTRAGSIASPPSSRTRSGRSSTRPHYAIIQVQPVIEQEAVPGEAPPTPEADPDQPVVSVIMERNLGDVRFPGAMLTIFSGLHVRGDASSCSTAATCAPPRRGGSPSPSRRP